MKTHKLLVGLRFFLWLAATPSFTSAQVPCFCDFCDHSASVMQRGRAEEQVSCVSAAGERTRADRLQFRTVVECALRQWRCRDGALAFTLSDALLDLLRDNPQVFCQIMNDNRDAFDQWVANLGTWSFVDYGSTSVSRLKSKRRELIELLKHTQISDSSIRSIRDELIGALERITPKIGG